MIDDWSRPVYKCIENGILWKDITLGDDNPELYICQNSFDGEPDSPIKSELEIHYNTKYKENPNSFNYQMLSRLKGDCDYYLGYGDRYAKHLWAGNEQEQINKMKELYSSFADDEKPEWLTWEEILKYEKLMINNVTDGKQQ